LENGPQIVDLANQVRELKETVSIPISQILSLRSEVKAKSEESQNEERKMHKAELCFVIVFLELLLMGRG
jgi:hypothetical protein